MIEVLKTDVSNPGHANMLIDLIRCSFPDYEANFDLEDCDRILRIRTSSTTIQPDDLIGFLKRFGVRAEPLRDAVTGHKHDITTTKTV